MLKRLRRTSIKTRILCLPLLFMIVLALAVGMSIYTKETIETHITLPRVQNHILNGYKETLKAVAEVEASTLAEKVKNAKTREEKMAIVFNETDPIRFFADKSGYFFSYDMDGVRINIPINKADNGKNMMHLVDSKGNRMVEDCVKAAKKGGGFTEYWFEKEGKGVQPKLTYVHPIPGTDFFIGTGVYIDNVKEETKTLENEIDQKSWEYEKIQIALLLSLLAVAFLVTFLIARSVTRSLGGMSRELLASAEQVAAASSQVSSASTQLAEGASEQAASLEETSSSLEEMASMTRMNAEHAGEAKRLSENTKETVTLATRSMEQLTASMAEISQASEETSKIIKTIDEIAFQTNLLALNAAVEAARAGEAGAGFAVVAEEVRNLAMRSAEAARHTASMIEGTVKKVKEGSELVERTDREFREAAAGVARSSELVGEITEASNEQSHGIEQINKAVNEMDRVVQMNAANAEESASASQQMNGQAERMEELVDALSQLVGEKHGGVQRDRKGTARAAGGRKPAAVRTVAVSVTPAKRLRGNDPASGKALTAGAERDQTDPARLIPFDGEEGDC
ncbi:MAG: methyl-accepting chemotaxis protein [Syntrophobacteraceae bacterium]